MEMISGQCPLSQTFFCFANWLDDFAFGPTRITSYLHRFHSVDVAPSTAHRILIRYGMNRLPANQKRQPTGRPWHRYEKAQPGHRLQIDVKFLERIAGSRKRLY